MQSIRVSGYESVQYMHRCSCRSACCCIATFKGQEAQVTDHAIKPESYTYFLKSGILSRWRICPRSFLT